MMMRASAAGSTPLRPFFSWSAQTALNSPISNSLSVSPTHSTTSSPASSARCSFLLIVVSSSSKSILRSLCPSSTSSQPSERTIEAPTSPVKAPLLCKPMFWAPTLIVVPATWSTASCRYGKGGKMATSGRSSIRPHASSARWLATTSLSSASASGAVPGLSFQLPAIITRRAAPPAYQTAETWARAIALRVWCRVKEVKAWPAPNAWQQLSCSARIVHSSRPATRAKYVIAPETVM